MFILDDTLLSTIPIAHTWMKFTALCSRNLSYSRITLYEFLPWRLMYRNLTTLARLPDGLLVSSHAFG